MAFKLVDNPGSSDNRRKQRSRAANVIKEKLPSEEIKVNHSGKIACLVCPNWPVFDTYAMLAVHRNSVRHESHKETWDALVMEKHFEEEKKEQKLHLRKELLDKSEPPMITKTKLLVNQVLDCDDADPASASVENRTTYNSNYVHQKTQKQLDETVSSNVIVHANRKPIRNAPYSTGNRRPYSCEGDGNHKGNQPEKPSVKQPRQDHDLKLLQQGWIKDTNGKWIKDENCEFDSDEEAPC